VEDHRQWRATVVSDGGERIDVASNGGRESTTATVALATTTDMTTAATTAANTTTATTTTATATATTAVARFKRSDIQTHYFSTLDGICWATF